MVYHGYFFPVAITIEDDISIDVGLLNAYVVSLLAPEKVVVDRCFSEVLIRKGLASLFSKFKLGHTRGG